jgi:hypothetical protein
MKTPITKESLLKFGMIETLDPGMPMSKVIMTEGDEEICLAVTQYFNADNISIVIKGVGQILLAIECIEDLEAIERMMPVFDSFD